MMQPTRKSKPIKRQPMRSKIGLIFDKKLKMLIGMEHRKQSLGGDRPASEFNPIKYQSRHNNHGSFSPFRTVSRESRNSYLLRVTHEPNVRTNYEINADALLTKSPKYTLPKSEFERRIDVGYETRDRSLEQPPATLEVLPRKCRKSVDCGDVKRPLTVSDFMKWRKTFHQMDFTKQVDFKNDSDMNSTAYRTLDLAATTRQSNFNNMSRFSTRPKLDKAHAFKSDSPHKYLQDQQPQPVPGFDLEKTNWNQLKKMWDGNRADLKFDRFRERISVRQDRSEPAWNPRLDYNPRVEAVKTKSYKNIDLSLYPIRQNNDTPSKYPIRLSQRLDYGMLQYPELKQLALEVQNSSNILI